MPYCVKVKKRANRDIVKVYDYIEQMYFAPIAAEKFLRGIYNRIAILETLAEVFAVSTYEDVLRYGRNARTIIYKGFTVIYTVRGHQVTVHRIIHGSLIKK